MRIFPDNRGHLHPVEGQAPQSDMLLVCSDNVPAHAAYDVTVCPLLILPGSLRLHPFCARIALHHEQGRLVDLLSIVGILVAFGAIIGGNALEGGHVSALLNGPALVLLLAALWVP